MPETPTSNSPRSEDVDPVLTPAFKSILTLQVGVVVVAGLYLAHEVLIPITLAVLLSFVLSPLVDLLRHLRLGRVPSVLLAVILAIGIVTVIATVVGSQVAVLARHIPEYAGNVEQKIETVRAITIDRIYNFMDQIASHQPMGPPSSAVGSKSELVTKSPDTNEAAQKTQGSVIALAQRYLSPVLSPIATLGIVVIVAIFVLLQKEDLRDRMIRLFGAADLHRTTIAINDAAQRLSKYFVTQLSINTTFAAVIGAGLFLIGVPNFILWGILAGLLRFVPYVGAFISAGLPLGMAAAVDPGWSMVIWTAVLFVVAELLVSQAVEPFLYGHNTGLSPFAVVVSAIFWSWLWGPIGLILSTPMTLCLVVLGRHVERLEFLDVLLGDRPALTPVETLYQRILAGDVDEVQDQAEAILKERSLASYYDEIVLKGLQMAANDAERGVLRRRQLETIKNTISALVGELASIDVPDPTLPDSQEDAVPDKSRTEPETATRLSLSKASKTGGRAQPQILCLAGRGPLDDLVSAMLAQLLDKQGLHARTAPYQAASRETIGSFDTSNVSMICISFLEISGSPSHLRYLVRRLRQRLPEIPTLVGLWCANDPALTDKRVSAAIGADHHAGSLCEAVKTCIDVVENDGTGRSRDPIKTNDPNPPVATSRPWHRPTRGERSG